MKYAAALLAAATGAAAMASNVTMVTEVVDIYTTYCPAPTEITHGSKTYTVTEPTTLTITDCPCTVTKPVTVTSSVVCHTCDNDNGWTNSTMASVTPTETGPATVVPTGSVTPTGPASVVPTAGAGKAVAGLAGVVGLAAFVL